MGVAALTHPARQSGAEIGWEPLRVRIRCFVDGVQAVYCVEDHGLVIDEYSQFKVWGLFSRLEETGSPPGEGWGLTLVRRIVHRHSGRVWLESGSGQGSRFIVKPVDFIAFSEALRRLGKSILIIKVPDSNGLGDRHAC
jgi:hypothetical protein